MAASKVFFDPDCHPDNTLKAFNEFVIDFNLRYAATYPDPPKVSLDAAMARFKLEKKATTVSPDQYDEIVDAWKEKDKVAKLLGLYSSRRFYNDWMVAAPVEAERKAANFDILVQKMRKYYAPTENLTLKNYQFRALAQEKSETFIAFCNRVEKEANHCSFNCTSDECTAALIAIRDQIIIGTHSDTKGGST